MKIKPSQSKSINAGHRGGSLCSSNEIPVMGMERRERPVQPSIKRQPKKGRSAHEKAKPYNINKHLVLKAFKQVKANKGTGGVDGQSLKDFEKNLDDNLYKIWNRLSSGSYHPPAVKQVIIPKADGGTRQLGIPTVGDRVAQMVVKMQLEPTLEQIFHPNSFGYRPNKSAHDALKLTQKRCHQREWVVDIDIKGFFDNIEHEKLIMLLSNHIKESWHLIYIQRWLNAPITTEDGSSSGKREKGTPQGGVISPLLANVYLHYVFDSWVENEVWGNIQFERYADDIVCHCTSEKQANWLLKRLEGRFAEYGLTLHPGKSKIAYCKSQYSKSESDNTSFDFLGYTFRPRWTKQKNGQYGLFFYAEISPKAAKKIKQEINH